MLYAVIFEGKFADCTMRVQGAIGRVSASIQSVPFAEVKVLTVRGVYLVDELQYCRKTF